MFRNESTALNHLMKVWNINVEEQTLVAVLRREVALVATEVEKLPEFTDVASLKRHVRTIARRKQEA